MREHLGVDVDSLYEEDLMANDPEKSEMQQDVWDPDAEQRFGQENGTTVKAAHTTAIGGLLKTTGNGIAESKSLTEHLCDTSTNKVTSYSRCS